MPDLPAEDTLLDFFKSLIKDKKEQAVLQMIFENRNEDEIIETLIQYKPQKQAE